jgi:sulfur transfer protein SufE
MPGGVELMRHPSKEKSVAQLLELGKEKSELERQQNNEEQDVIVRI